MALPAPALRPLPSRSLRGATQSRCAFKPFNLKPSAVGELNSVPRLHNRIDRFYGRAHRFRRLDAVFLLVGSILWWRKLFTESVVEL